VGVRLRCVFEIAASAAELPSGVLARLGRAPPQAAIANGAEQMGGRETASRDADAPEGGGIEEVRQAYVQTGAGQERRAMVEARVYLGDGAPRVRLARESQEQAASTAGG